MEYWQAAYPNEKRPAFHFLNPNGFKSLEELIKPGESGKPRIIEVLARNIEVQGTPGDVAEIKRHQAIIDQIKSQADKANINPNERILLFDTCIHTGNNLEPVYEKLREAGFRRVSVGTVSGFRVRSSLKPDFTVFRGEPPEACLPFLQDSGVIKGFDIQSNPTEDRQATARATRLRNEMKHVMDEEIKRHQIST